MRYPGGKGKNYQHLINLIPPHCVYIETHLGGGAVLRNKSPAEKNIGIDIDKKVISHWKDLSNNAYELYEMDAICFLKSYKFQGNEFVYCDPPYLPETRRKKRIYKYEYSFEDHVSLLNVISKLKCNVMISGYPSELYKKKLCDWICVEIPGASHIGKREEIVWLNFNQHSLHDYRYLGKDFRERERIKRKASRWKTKAAMLPRFERHAIISSLIELEKELSKEAQINEY